MAHFEHNKIVEHMVRLDLVPDETEAYAEWVKADGHLALLRDNADQAELIVYGVNRSVFVHSVVVSEKNTIPLDQDDLLGWSGNTFAQRVSYNWLGTGGKVHIEEDHCDMSTKTLEGAQRLVYGREFAGLRGNDSIQYDILQEYLHLSDSYWRPEHRAYCRFDDNGDFDHVISLTTKEERGRTTLISFQRDPLEEYLAASSSVLVRMFDFMLLRKGTDYDFLECDEPEKLVNEDPDFIYRQKIDYGKASYTRGIQVIRLGQPEREIFSSIKNRISGSTENGRYVTFVGYDWRSKCVAKISTDPAATTNYFQTYGNTLPFELSPAFFRPEVLLKYKADREKYKIDERLRSISCRSGWELRSYDVNEAGQIHAYICDLRHLPYAEQLYWLSYNENPKSGISKRAIENDFKGNWYSSDDPLIDILSIVAHWKEVSVPWWKLRDEVLLDGISTPLTSNKEEWAGAFGDLSKLVIEGFVVNYIRKRLKTAGIEFKTSDRSIALIETYLIGCRMLDEGKKLHGLRTVQFIRSKITTHAGGSEVRDLLTTFLEEYETYTAHFTEVCRTVASELEMIEEAFS